MKKKFNIILLLVMVIGIIFSIVLLKGKSSKELSIEVDLASLTYSNGDSNKSLKRYTQDDFDEFLSDYSSNKLPDIYITEFLFDGVGMYKPYDLDDFVEKGNEISVDALKITNININTTGDVSLKGELKGGMISVNTNNINGDINLILNGVNIDTNSKKVPVLYVYNKDINYTTHKVTVKTQEETTNSLEGGKLKKVSLIPKEDLNSYKDKYAGDSNTWYTSYTNYYGVYSSVEINNILFAREQADNEDLSNGDPYYFYKAAGAISSDIDLYFEGEGTLTVISKNKEGIETKGNLTFSGGVGDYIVKAYDDCLNTTSDENNARNTLTIDVNSLIAIVSSDSDEGDAIDSNGTLEINGGTIVAVSKPGSDAGIDSSKGTYIKGGTVISTGDMYDEISSESKQKFISFSFSERVEENNLITLLDKNDNVVFSYKTDRSYTNLVYSSSKLNNESYYLYKGGNIIGDNNNGLYMSVTNYERGTQLGYSSTGASGMGGFMPGDSNMTHPENRDLSFPPDNGMRDGNNPFNNTSMGTSSATNKEFTLSSIANLFSGVATYSGQY